MNFELLECILLTVMFTCDLNTSAPPFFSYLKTVMAITIGNTYHLLIKLTCKCRTLWEMYSHNLLILMIRKWLLVVTSVNIITIFFIIIYLNSACNMWYLSVVNYTKLYIWPQITCFVSFLSSTEVSNTLFSSLLCMYMN